jgi:arylsulfatase A-like enzyme
VLTTRTTPAGPVDAERWSAAVAEKEKSMADHATSENERLPRDILPIPDRPVPPVRTFDAKDPETSFPMIEPLRPPSGAPNVLICMLDDVGFGASSAFGGPCRAPTAERLARGGLKYTRFHTTALCSPTRAALLTGRNHHSVGMGGVTDMATSSPGYTSVRPKSKATIAEILKLNGYSTAQFGKCHEVPAWEQNPFGPFERWPVGNGFEYFYGFVGGETNQWYPALYEGTTPKDPEKTPEEGYHFMEDMTTRAIRWARQQKALLPDKPFLMHFMPGATHAPHHVPTEWADKYRGAFDRGWDRVREETFARQKRLGVIPENAQLPSRHDGIPAWDDMPDELKPVLARQMEVYAGFLEYADYHFGRLVDTLENLGVLDDTLIYYIIGDNGASAESTPQGCFNELAVLVNGMADLETPEFLIGKKDQLGGPEAFNQYATGWAYAMSTPYRYTKQVASHWGGVRNGTVVHWPAGIAARGELRHQFHHVIDVAPTILEVAGLPEPTVVNSSQQAPMEGTSMRYSFDDAAAADRHETQYFEMVCNRGIYHRGWSAVTKHRAPWEPLPPPSVNDDVWELYGPDDWTQAQNVAHENPEKLRDLQRLWLMEAARYNVLPLDDRFVERILPEVAGRPQIVRGTSQFLFGGTGRMSEASIISVKNKAHAVTAEIAVPKSGAEGVIVAQGGRFGGWSLYAKGGRLKYCYNFVGIELFMIEGTHLLPAGSHTVRMEFKYDGGGKGKGGTASLYVDGTKVGEGRVDRTVPIGFSIDETCEVGREAGAPVSPDYDSRQNRFSGEVNWVSIDVTGDDNDRDVTPEERFQASMAWQ